MQIWASDLKSTLFHADSSGQLAPSKTLDRPTLYPDLVNSPKLVSTGGTPPRKSQKRYSSRHKSASWEDRASSYTVVSSKSSGNMSEKTTTLTRRDSIVSFSHLRER